MNRFTHLAATALALFLTINSANAQDTDLGKESDGFNASSLIDLLMGWKDADLDLVDLLKLDPKIEDEVVDYRVYASKVGVRLEYSVIFQVDGADRPTVWGPYSSKQVAEEVLGRALEAGREPTGTTSFEIQHQEADYPESWMYVDTFDTREEAEEQVVLLELLGLYAKIEEVLEF